MPNCHQQKESLEQSTSGNSSLSFIRSKLSPVEGNSNDIPFEKIKEQGTKLAEKFGGSCISDKFSIVKGQKALKFKC